MSEMAQILALLGQRSQQPQPASMSSMLGDMQQRMQAQPNMAYAGGTPNFNEMTGQPAPGMSQPQPQGPQPALGGGMGGGGLAALLGPLMQMLQQRQGQQAGQMQQSPGMAYAGGNPNFNERTGYAMPGGSSSLAGIARGY